MSWRQQAACLGSDPELFFPITEIGPSKALVEAARQVCDECPVQAPCLQWALAHGIDHGIWGGLSEYERRDRRRVKRQLLVDASRQQQVSFPHPPLDQSPATPHGAV